MGDQLVAVEETPLRNVSWPQVTLTLGVVFFMLTATVILAVKGLNAEAIMTTVMLVLVTLLQLLGWSNQTRTEAKVDQVKEMSNGRLAELSEQNKALQSQVTALALQVNMPPPVNPNSVVTTSDHA